MKRALLFCMLFVGVTAQAQQYALLNTKTLYDSFENPARKMFTQDTSRQFAINLLPSIALTAFSAGPAQYDLRRAMSTGLYTARDLAIGKGKFTQGVVDLNTYIGMLKIYTSVLKHGELGLSWQIRSQSYGKVTNETLAIIDSYKLLDTMANYSNIFNNKASSATFQQFSIGYRQNIDRFTGIGVKLSYLSGILYSGLKIDSSSLGTNLTDLTYGLFLSGKLRSSFGYHGDTTKANGSPLKNPGIATTVAFTRNFRFGWTAYAQVKDLGFIRWTKSPVYSFSGPVVLKSLAGSNGKVNLGPKLDSIVTDTTASKLQSFITPLNTRAEVVITKQYENYRFSFLLSQNLFNRLGDFGLTQNYTWRSLNLGLSTVYNTMDAFQVGFMAMIKTRGFEIYGGSDQVFKTSAIGRGLAGGDENYAKGYTGVSFYMGIGISFGRVMEHPWYSNRVRVN